MQSYGRWFFYRDAARFWRWERYDEQFTVTVDRSRAGFLELIECVLDAVDHGYVGGGLRARADQ
jgi:hypothetical protein